jgi:hypothetical protein
MIKKTYTARGDKIDGMRFVRACHPTGYVWCIQSNSAKRYDLQQGTCDAEDLPDDVRAAADSLLGRAFSYVEWPQ